MTRLDILHLGGMKRTATSAETMRRGDIDLDKIHAPATPSRFAHDREQELKAKFGLPDGLILEGAFNRRHETTVKEYCDGKDNERMAGMKLAVGNTIYQGKPLKIWFEVSK